MYNFTVRFTYDEWNNGFPNNEGGMEDDLITITSKYKPTECMKKLSQLKAQCDNKSINSKDDKYFICKEGEGYNPLDDGDNADTLLYIAEKMKIIKEYHFYEEDFCIDFDRF